MPLGPTANTQVSNGTSSDEGAGPAYTLVAEAPTETWFGSEAGGAGGTDGALVPFDDLMSIADLAPGEGSLWIRTTGYGFSIPDNATITGITLETRVISLQVLGWDPGDDDALAGSLVDAGVRLILANAIQGNENGDTTVWPNHSAAALAGFSLNFLAETRLYGGTTDLWGLALTPSDVNDPTFGAAIGVANPAAATFDLLAAVDSLTITVHYTLPAESSSEVAVAAAISRTGASVNIRASISKDVNGDVEITASIGFGATITTPAAGCPTVTTSEMAIAWSMSSTAQVGFRVQIFEDASATIEIYDSGFIGGSNKNFTLPAGVLPAPATNLYVRVTVTNDGGITVASELQCFNTSFPTSVNVSGVEAITVGGCDEPRVLPGVRIQWSAVTEGPGETFLTYAVRRRLEGADSWLTIAEVGDITETSIIDYNVAPVARYEYSVVWRASSGTNVLQAADTTPPPIGTVDFEFNYLHVANLQSNDADFQWVRMDSFQAEKSVQQEIRYVQPWGRDLPTGYVGQQLATVISVPLREDLLSSPARWDKLRDLVRLQRDRSAVLTMRFGRSKELYFVTVATLDKSDRQKTTSSRVEMRETFYEEGVAF